MKKMNRKYFSLEKNKRSATLSIYGDITSYRWDESDVTSYNLSRQLEELKDVDQIDVFINSYGGEVAEGLAIYNALKRHKAKIRTVCDGFACSIASVIFMAGDERVMNEASLLMIHNAWTYASGNAEGLRKAADDLEKITQASVEAYKAHSSLEEEEIKKLMDAETWILPDEAMDYGFATSVEKTEREKASQNAWLQLFNIVKAHQEAMDGESDDEEELEDALDDEEQEDTDDSEVDTEEEPEKDDSEEEEVEEIADDEAEDEPEDETDVDEEEPTDEDSEEETDADSNAEDEEETAQKWSGFFNALLKL